MNPDNTTNQNQSATPVNQPAATAPPQAPDAVSQDITKLKSFIDKLKEGIKQKRQTAKEVGTASPAAAAKPSFLTVFTKNKLLMIALAIFVVLCVILIAASMYKSFSNKSKVTPIPTATPATVINATPSAIFVPSRYATDSAVLELEKNINEVDAQLSGTSIKESQLTPQTYDFNITF